MGIGDTMLWMVLLGGRIRSEEDVVGDPRIRNSSHSAAHLSKQGARCKVGVREPPLGRFIRSWDTVVPVANACTIL